MKYVKENCELQDKGLALFETLYNSIEKLCEDAIADGCTMLELQSILQAVATNVSIFIQPKEN